MHDPKQKRVAKDGEYITFDLALMDSATRRSLGPNLTDSSQIHLMTDRQFIAGVLEGKITATDAEAAYRGTAARRKMEVSQAYRNSAPSSGNGQGR